MLTTLPQLDSRVIVFLQEANRRASLSSACAAGASDAIAGLILRRSIAAIFNCWFSQSVQAVVSSEERRGFSDFLPVASTWAVTAGEERGRDNIDKPS